MSLKCMIDKWLHKGQISQEEYDAVVKKLDGHDKQVRADERKRILGTVDCKQSDNPIRREVDFSISFDSMLNPEEVMRIMLEQMREQMKGEEK